MMFLLRLLTRKSLPPLDADALRRGEWNFALGTLP
jgi:hypothetical protein